MGKIFTYTEKKKFDPRLKKFEAHQKKNDSCQKKNFSIVLR